MLEHPDHPNPPPHLQLREVARLRLGEERLEARLVALGECRADLGHSRIDRPPLRCDARLARLALGGEPGGGMG